MEATLSPTPHIPRKIVALVGKPNVGKSTLFNRLTKTNKAIVDPTPGVTRDRHYEQVTWNEQSFILVDTGGIELDKGDVITDQIRGQTWQAVDEADIVLFMLDGKEGLSSEDFEVADHLRRSGKPVHFLVNKIDGAEVEQLRLPTFYELGADTLWPVSSAHGYGIRTFLDHFVGELGHGAGAENQPQLPSGTLSLACLGRPNVGKSSLINRLTGEDRMVVSDIPGTTRDSVDTLLEKNGRHFLLIDTAGIRRKGKVQEKIEKFSVMRALSALERCDLVLILLDAGEGITEQDTKIIGYAMEQGRGCVVVVNKWDLVQKDKKRQKQILEEVERATTFIGYAPVLTLSALTGVGTKKIFPTLLDVQAQFCREFSTGKLNRVLQKAVSEHSPSLHQGRRLKFYYTTQVTTKPPTFLVFVNYPKGVHFSYYRYLVNFYRNALGIDKSPLRLVLKERQRKRYD
ncbi:MAG: ribosome biogenesis GTPase Der [Desulfobulbaceae bacterium]|nr:ribosome biogenesis GTPase Der [Desulfobulbaceae bacterium]